MLYTNPIKAIKILIFFKSISYYAVYITFTMLVCPCTAVVHEEYRESEGDNKQGTGDLSQEYQALSSTIR